VDPILTRTVGAEITFDVETAATVIVQVTPTSTAGTITTETFTATSDEVALPEPTTIQGEYGGVLHAFRAEPGLLRIDYRADLDATFAPAPQLDNADLERVTMLRPSRYCPSDHVVGMANSEFGHLPTAGERAQAIERWISKRINYVPGSSNVHDDAEHTLLSGQGICRDFAHLGAMLCRALDVPARFAAVYAPGLTPMDFHAVYEAWHDGHWWAYDGTRKAPRQTMVRVATGRDAADTPFATVLGGRATFRSLQVTAYTPGRLAIDTHDSPLVLGQPLFEGIS